VTAAQAAAFRLARHPKNQVPRTTIERADGAFDVPLFARATPALREGLAREAEAMGRFLGTDCLVRIRTV
jgi:hypothetical protein